MTHDPTVEELVVAQEAACNPKRARRQPGSLLELLQDLALFLSGTQVEWEDNNAA